MSLSEPKERNASLDADMEKLEHAYFLEIMMEHGMMDHMDDSVLGDGTLESLDGQTMSTLDNRVKRIPQLNNSDPYYQKAKSARPPPRQHSRRSSPTTSTELPIPTERVKDTTIHPGRISRILYSSPISRLLNTTSSAEEGSGKSERASSSSDTENVGHTGMISRLLSSASSSKLFNTAPSTPERSRESDRTTSGFRTHNLGDAPVHSGRFSKFLQPVLDIRNKLVNAAPSTPERSRKSDRTKFGSGSGSGTSSDGETFPESPPGFRGVVEIPSSEHDDGEETEAIFTSKQKYTIAACLGVFLIVGISVCAAALSNIQEPNTDSNTSSQGFDDWDWTFKPTQQVSAPPTLSSSPTNEPTITPRPTQTPSMAPTFTKEANFTQIMTQISPSTLEDIENSGSPQNRAFQWIVRDPNYYSYSEDRIVQRWALALFSLEISTTRRANRRLNEALDTWMEYTDECNWWTSFYESRVGCDARGVFRNLIIRNVALDGTIPSELCLLTSLSKLY
jgi:hypothetical protein